MPHDHEPSTASEHLFAKNSLKLTDEQFHRLAQEALKHLEAEQASYPAPPQTENEIKLSRMD